MKYTLALIVIMVFGMSGCSSQKKFVKEAPFSVENPTCTPFSGGLEATSSGFTLLLPLSMQTDDEITFEKVYFRGRVLDMEWVTKDGKRFLQSRYVSKSNEKPDIIMHEDPMMEVGNQPPGDLVEKEEFPFELNPDEAVIAYVHKGKMHYTKINGIKDKSTLFLRTMEKN